MTDSTEMDAGSIPAVIEYFKKYNNIPEPA